MNELNEKLARWRWPDIKDIQVSNGIYLMQNFAICDDLHPFFVDLFTNDLNAIFKWLVPEIKQLDKVEISKNEREDGSIDYTAYIYLYDGSYKRTPNPYWHKEPARALAEVIGKMIGEKK